MLSRLSLRLRVLLFFAFLASAGTTASVGALWVGHGRALETGVTNGFIFAAILITFALLALNAGVWLLFDENVAKPIQRLSADMRVRAHADVTREMSDDLAKYLGDLAPAAEAVSRKLQDQALTAAQAIAAETERLSEEKAQLSALLTELPVAMLMINSANQIVLYDGQAAEILSQIHVPRLNASVFDYFDHAALSTAQEQADAAGSEIAFELRAVSGDLSSPARLKRLAAGGYLLTLDGLQTARAPDAARPLIYNFDLLQGPQEYALDAMPLNALTFCVFDTETTGLLPHKDSIVQLGAVRVVAGRIVEGEEIDQLVDPGRKIPEASINVHRVTNEMVQGAPDIQTVARLFHGFCKDAVIVAHNAPFDMAFLRRQTSGTDLTWDFPVLDTVLLSAVVFGQNEVHTLDALAERLDVTIPEELRHSALGDAIATAQVLVRVLPILQARGLDTFGKVVAQTKAHGRLLEDMN